MIITVKVIILGGFLGSGKTTSLMLFARYLADVSDPDKEYKIVILENEVGEVGIDDQYLRGGGFTVNNLFAGCACCTVSGELISAAERIRSEMDPEWLIIETTGIAYPGLMRDNLHNALSLESRIVILADASRWRRLRIPMDALLRGQIENCDAVIINKIDLVQDDVLQSVESDIMEIEPNAPIFKISAMSEVSGDIWGAVAGVL
jgi:G3E family GTPase